MGLRRRRAAVEALKRIQSLIPQFGVGYRFLRVARGRDGRFRSRRKGERQKVKVRDFESGPKRKRP